jgi:hypothetical protein
MKQEDIIRMARVAGVRDDGYRFEFSEYKYLERFAALVRTEAQAEEREACAKVCETDGIGAKYQGDVYAEVIRARGQA